MSWIPLPFPKCPSCLESWKLTKHYKCPTKSDIYINTESRECGCFDCRHYWHIEETQFYCSCEYHFSATQVEEAFNTTLILKQKLKNILMEMQIEESKINDIALNSIKSWLSHQSYQIGKLFGTLTGTIIKLFKTFLG